MYSYFQSYLNTEMQMLQLQNQNFASTRWGPKQDISSI